MSQIFPKICIRSPKLQPQQNDTPKLQTREAAYKHTSLYSCLASAHLSSSGLTRSIMSRSTAELEMTLLEQGIRVFCTRSLYSTGGSWMSVDIVAVFYF